MDYKWLVKLLASKITSGFALNAQEIRDLTIALYLADRMDKKCK